MLSGDCVRKKMWLKGVRHKMTCPSESFGVGACDYVWGSVWAEVRGLGLVDYLIGRGMRTA
jgi:hypothetical protein